MALEVVSATLDGRDTQVVTGALAWQQPLASGWLQRSIQVNRLLREHKRSTHLLRVVDTESEQETWYAGRAGVSLAAAVESMAVHEETLRNALIVAAIGERRWLALTAGTLIQREATPYWQAFEEKLAEWQADDKELVVLTGECLDQLEIANATEIQLNVDLKKFTFRRASTAMLSAGVLRWRDCLLFGMGVALSILLGFVYVTWAAESVEQPSIVWQLPDLEPAPQLKYQAAMQLAAIAAELGNYDPTLWRSVGVASVRYDADESTLSLHSEEQTKPLASRALAIPAAMIAPSVVNSLDDSRRPLEQLFDLFGIAVVFDEPFALDSSTDAQRVTASLREFPVNRLIDLAGLLRELPLELHKLTCSVNDGAISQCELTFAIQGVKA